MYLTIAFILFVLTSISLLYLRYPNRISYQQYKVNTVIAIPCSKNHIRHLQSTIDAIENQTYKPQCIIISVNGVEEEPHIETSIPIVWIRSIKKLNAAINRNRCIRYLINNHIDFDYISFVDADDYIFPEKLEIMINMMKQHNIDIGLHEFIYDGMRKIPHNRYIIMPDQMREIEIQTRKNTDETNSLSIRFMASGYSTISKQLAQSIQFDERYDIGEDTKFIRDAIQNGYQAMFINRPLMIYYRNNSDTNK